MTIDIFQGDCRKLSKDLVKPNSVDLIFTDPPYPKEYHYLYQWLAREAKRVLKPNGFLLTYAGPYWKHKVMMTLGRHLDYYYDFVLIHGSTSILWPRKIVSGYKSILCYRLKEGKSLQRMNVLGKFSGSEQDKRFHSWGQSEIEARYYIDVFSHEGDLVVDYFLGGGTTAEVCKRIGRNFIGFEIDQKTYQLSLARIDGALGPQEKGRQQEMVI